VAPSTAADAKGLLAAAIRDDDPVLFVEHRALYWSRGDVPAESHVVPIGTVAVRRPGTDVTVVAASRMAVTAVAAAERLAEEGVQAEIIDARSLSPLDLDTIVASVGRTGRLLVVHEAVEVGGMGAEIAARVQEAAFDDLRAPVVRLGAPFAPVPFSPELERRFVPDEEDVVEAVRRLVKEDRRVRSS